MGNFKFGYNFISYTPTASGESTAYPDDNLTLNLHPLRAYHSPSSAATTVSCDLGSAHNTIGAMLNDVNFTTAYLSQSTNASTWTAEVGLTITMDSRVQRYKVYADTTFTSRYIRLRIPAQTATDNSTYYRVGNLVFLDTVLTLASNPSEPYDISADEPMTSVKSQSGNDEDIVLGDAVWEGSFGKNVLARTNESDYWTLNSIGKNEPMIFFENTTDTSKTYLCRRRSSINISWLEADLSGVQRISFKEIR